MPFIRTNGVLLHYRVHGRADAPVLALANSLGTDARIWDGVIERLAPRYRIVSYDKRGHGLSDAPAGEYSLDDHVADLAGLLEALGIGRLALAGVSVGGLIAQGFALRHAERLTALVLCDTAAKLGDAQLWAARMDAVRTDGMAALADQVMERWFSPDFRRDEPDALAGWRNMFLRSDPTGYAATCATLRDSDLRDAVGAIRMPVLVVAGEADASTPVAVVQACAEAIPGARLAVIAGAGHIPSIERPGELAQLIATFLGEAGHG